MSLYLDSLDANGELRAWPDGGSLLDQPVKLIGAFRIIGRERALALKGAA